jgi:hypothetical protein
MVEADLGQIWLPTNSLQTSSAIRALISEKGPSHPADENGPFLYV